MSIARRTRSVVHDVIAKPVMPCRNDRLLIPARIRPRFIIRPGPGAHMRYWWLGMALSGGLVWYGINYLLPWK